jgi:hypothetical protein
VAMTVVPAFATTDELVDAVRLVNQARRKARNRDLPYRLAVLGNDPTDLVQRAGGLLFDHIMAGWDVTVLVPAEADPRPLRILGTRIIDLDTALAMDLLPALASRRHTPWPHKVVMSADLCVHKALLHDAVRRSFDRGDTSTLLWGPPPSLIDHGNITTTEHHLSCAARAFKAHALDAASAGTADPTDVESFVSNKVRAPAPPALHLA